MKLTRASSIAIALVLYLCLQSSFGATVNGNYYVQLTARPSGCRKSTEFLGFLNKTCKAGTSPKNYGETTGPVLRGSANGKQWKQWTFKAVSKPAANGAVDVTIATYYPLSGKPLCMGNMVAEKPQACVLPDRYADRVHIHPKSPQVWTLIPVSGQADTFTIVFKDRKAGCLRYLSAPSSCSDEYVRLAAKDDGSGAQRWIIKLVNPPKPPAKKPSPPPYIDGVNVPMVNYSIAFPGYTKATFGLDQEIAFCASLNAAITWYPQYLLRCNVVRISDVPFDTEFPSGRRLQAGTAYVRGYTAFAVTSNTTTDLTAAATAANTTLNLLQSPTNVTQTFSTDFPGTNVTTDKAQLGDVSEPLAPPAPPSPSVSPAPPTPSASPSPSPSPSSSPVPLPVISPSPIPTPSAPPPPPAVTAPDAPTKVVVIPSPSSADKATISWTVPASDGGDPIIGYSVSCTSTPGGVKVGPKTFVGAATTTTGPDGFSGLTPETDYTCNVVAFNNLGPSTPGISNEFVTGSAAPAIGTATASSTYCTLATVTWSQSGSGVIDYEVECVDTNSNVVGTESFPASTACASTPCSTGTDGFYGLAGSTTYKCRVRFVTASGTGAWSSYSNTITSNACGWQYAGGCDGSSTWVSTTAVSDYMTLQYLGGNDPMIGYQGHAYLYDPSGPSWPDDTSGLVSATDYFTIAEGGNGKMYASYATTSLIAAQFDSTNVQWTPYVSPDPSGSYAATAVATGTDNILYLAGYLYAPYGVSVFSLDLSAGSPSWQTLGGPGGASFDIDPIILSLALDPTNTPYVLWADSNNNNHPEVTKWTGSAWTRLISGANNLPPVYSTSNIANIAISSNGDVFIAYPNQSYENLVFRLPAGTSTWEQLGVAGDLTPPGLPVYYLSLAVDPKGTPYIMVSDNLDYLFAYSWDGSAWTQLGSSSPARGFYFSFALFGPQQIPSFAYADYTTSYPCYMQYY